MRLKYEFVPSVLVGRIRSEGLMGERLPFKLLAEHSKIRIYISHSGGPESEC
jgi:hypothetical protein